MRIRFATPGDSPALLGIYAQYIETPITFECTLPSEAELAERIAVISRDYPYLVCEGDGVMVGYAYAHRHMEREAYQWNAELSVYLDRSATSKGLGKKLCLLLMEILKLQGVRTVYGGVTAPNVKSMALHRSLGFQLLGIYHNAGYKSGGWHDVSWYEKSIAPYDASPAPFVPISRIPREELERIVSSAL